MIKAVCRIWNLRLARYIAASVIALAADVGIFLLLLQLGAHAVAASAASYSIGILVHWLASSRQVFQDMVAERGLARTRQKAMFIVSALLGLALTTTIVWAGHNAGIDARLSKIVAIGASFVLTWTLRSRLVFRGEAGA